MSKWLQDFFQYKAIVEANLTVTSAATVQQYYKYTYSSTVYVGATSGTWPTTKGTIRFNDANSAIATEAAMTNLTNETVDQGIGSYVGEQPAGVYMHVRSTQTNKFGIYKIAASPATRGVHRYFAVTVVNGLALNDGDEVTVSFSSNANCVWDATNETITANGVSIAPNVLAVDTIADAVATVLVNATNHRKEFAVLDPGGNTANPLLLPIPWNVIVDNTMGILRQIGGMSDFAINRGIARYCQPAANASARATDSTILATRTRLTLTAHGLPALVAGIDTYLMIQATGGGWTVNEKVKILSIVDANTIIVDKLFADVSGNPDFYLITESMPIVTVANPAGRTWTHYKYEVNIQFPSSAGTKTLIAKFGTATYWAPAAITTSLSVLRTIHVKNLGDTAKQRGNNQASVNVGTDAIQNSGTTVSSTEATGTTAPNFTVEAALSAAADYVEVVMLTASANW